MNLFALVALDRGGRPLRRHAGCSRSWGGASALPDFSRDPDGLAKGSGAAEAAVFGLLGLLIAFTFSGAASRFEDRRHLITEEANAIGTAYLRIDLLPGDAQPASASCFAAIPRPDRRPTRMPPSNSPRRDRRRRKPRRWRRCKARSGRRRGRRASGPEAPAQATMLLLPALERNDRHHHHAGDGEPESSAAGGLPVARRPVPRRRAARRLRHFAEQEPQLVPPGGFRIHPVADRST